MVGKADAARTVGTPLSFPGAPPAEGALLLIE
jgi:hypothetical protein